MTAEQTLLLDEMLSGDIAIELRTRGHSHAGLRYIVNHAVPSDRAFIGAIVTALDAAITASRLPSAGAETYLRRRNPSPRRLRQAGPART